MALAGSSPGAGWDKDAHDCIVRIGQGIDSLILPPGLFGGLAGLGLPHGICHATKGDIGELG